MTVKEKLICALKMLLEQAQSGRLGIPTEEDLEVCGEIHHLIESSESEKDKQHTKVYYKDKLKSVPHCPECNHEVLYRKDLTYDYKDFIYV